jgi:hypothetical protein
MAGKGGRIAGSGRKPGAKTLLKRDPSIAILAKCDPEKIWTRLLNSKDDKIVLDALKYLSDRAWGKPMQVIAGDSDGGAIVLQFSGATDKIPWLPQKQ